MSIESDNPAPPLKDLSPEERKKERRRLRRLKRKGLLPSQKASGDQVSTGILMPISDEGLKFIEKHDPDLAERIKLHPRRKPRWDK